MSSIYAVSWEESKCSHPRQRDTHIAVLQHTVVSTLQVRRNEYMTYLLHDTALGRDHMACETTTYTLQLKDKPIQAIHTTLNRTYCAKHGAKTLYCAETLKFKVTDKPTFFSRNFISRHRHTAAGLA